MGIMILMLVTPFNIFSASPRQPLRRQARTHQTPTTTAPLPDSIPLSKPVDLPAAVVEDELTVMGDSVSFQPVDTIAIENAPGMAQFRDGVVIAGTTELTGKKVFVPDPTKSVWLSALFPGLGQIYNRRYWKLPIVVGAYMGLGYGASWNNNMLRDYSRAYTDIMDSDPTTNSYMDFFPPNTDEASLNRSWLERTLKARKDMFRRNRDLCIIGMIGVYLVSIVDAYVDASLTNFDITPDLSMQVAPAVINNSMSPLPAIGVQWALNF